MSRGMGRRLPWWILALLFVGTPVLEIYLIVQLGQAVGAGWTIALLLASGALGSYLIKLEGGRAWRALQEALSSGRMPATELADGALILVGGTLLLTPGFVTDTVGLFCILPFTRPLARRGLSRLVSRRLTFTTGFAPGPFGSAGGTGGSGPQDRRSPGHPGVVQGDVVDED